MSGKQSEPNEASMWKDPDRFWIILGIVVIIVFAILIVQQSLSAPATFNTLPANINRDLAYQKYGEGVFVLDVRTPEEWAEFHIPGATLIPLDELGARAGEIPFDQEVIDICSHSIRSRTGRDKLLTAGHTQVSSITGGIIGWDAAGYPVVTGE